MKSLTLSGMARTLMRTRDDFEARFVRLREDRSTEGVRDAAGETVEVAPVDWSCSTCNGDPGSPCADCGRDETGSPCASKLSEGDWQYTYELAPDVTALGDGRELREWTVRPQDGAGSTVPGVFCTVELRGAARLRQGESVRVREVPSKEASDG